MKDTDQLKVLVVEPQKPPYVQEIDGSLKGMQDMVGGLIETVSLFDEPQDSVCIVCNEMGKQWGLEPNRLLMDTQGKAYDYLCGTFFIVGENPSGEAFVSLTDQQIEKYQAKYSEQNLMAILKKD